MENFLYLLITYQSVPSYLKPSTSHLQNKPILTLWLPNHCHTVLPVRRNSLRHIGDEGLVMKSFPCASCGFSHTGLKGWSVAGRGSGTTSDCATGTLPLGHGGRGAGHLLLPACTGPAGETPARWLGARTEKSKAVLCLFHPLRSSFAGLTFKCFSFWGECSQGLVRHGCSSR